MDNIDTSHQEMEVILRESSLGFLGMSSDGEPYVVPLNYAYLDGKILFHCALQGKKLDCLRANPAVCFAVARQFGPVADHGQGSPCHIDSDSVICFGRARVLDDLTEREAALNAFVRAFYPDVEPLAPDRVRACTAVEITVTEMTGRRERDWKHVHWRCTL